MIIRLDGEHQTDTDAARQELNALTSDWGYELAEQPTPVVHLGTSPRDDRKVIDPVSLSALIVSLPSAALAVLDLADRIRKRRRATQLIDHAHNLAARHVTVYVMVQDSPVRLTSLTPDHLLDIAPDHDAADGDAS